jgi:response regulator NasT
MTEEPQHLRVLVADEREQHLDPISEAVERLGHEVVAREVDIAEVGQATHDHRPDLAIVALHEDTDHALELITQIVEEASCPVIALADEASSSFVAKAAQRGVWAHMDSTKPGEMRGAIDVVLERYREWRRLLGAFEKRARIERAKGVLMERHGLGQQEAFDRLRGEARNARRPIAEVVDELLGAVAEDRGRDADPRRHA